MPPKYVPVDIVNTTKLSKFPKKSIFWKLASLNHDHRDQPDLEHNTLIPAFLQINIIDRLRDIGYTYSLAMDSNNLPCIVALSSDSVHTAHLYPDVNGNFNYRASP
jgi:hypothetical protein